MSTTITKSEAAGILGIWASGHIRGDHGRHCIFHVPDCGRAEELQKRKDAGRGGGVTNAEHYRRCIVSLCAKMSEAQLERAYRWVQAVWLNGDGKRAEPAAARK